MLRHRVNYYTYEFDLSCPRVADATYYALGTGRYDSQKRCSVLTIR